MSNFDKILDLVLEHEGGFVDHPADRGGATNKGVTLRTLQRHKMNATVEDLQNITADLISRIYFNDYYKAARCDELHPAVAYIVFDMAVNSGVRNAIMMLQSAVRTTVDGIFGINTLRAYMNADIKTCIDRMLQYRVNFFLNLAKRDISQNVFLRGWINRLLKLQADVYENFRYTF